MNRVGSAIHGCIAAAMGSVGQGMSIDEIRQMLAAWRLEKSIDAQQVLGQIEGLARWIAGRWPEAKMLCEVSGQCAVRERPGRERKKPPGALPCASPSIEMMMSEPRQCTVCGADRFVLDLIWAPSITLCSRGAFGSMAQSTMCRFDERTPGTIR
jgi:hypothetical protein